MTNQYPQHFSVFDLTAHSEVQRFETLGSKEKRWLNLSVEGLSNRQHLFKVGRPNTGENWSERVSCHLAKYIGLPTANYELAFVGDERGVISERFMADTARFFPGNFWLAKVIDGYEGKKRLKQIEYKLGNVLKVLSNMGGLRPPPESGVNSAIDAFVGYLVFDILIGNTDRHHENWGIVLQFQDELEWALGPTFDHASSLGRELTDEARKLKLTSRDVRADVSAYAKKTKTAFYGHQQKTITSAEMLTDLKNHQPKECEHWCDKIGSITINELVTGLSLVPDDWISPISAEFALLLLKENQLLIKEFSNAK